jgi:hypothetical protein
MMYTVEVAKQDKRVKGGVRNITKLDIDTDTAGDAERKARLIMWGRAGRAQGGLVFTVHETYVTRKNIQSGKEFQERYDTPYYCSPSSETFWSM